MNARQNAYLRMCAAVRATCDAHAAAWMGFAPFADAYAAWLAILDRTPAALAQQDTSTKGATAQKRSLRLRVEDDVNQLTAVLLLYAATIHDANLALDLARATPRMVARLGVEALTGHAGFLRQKAGAADGAALAALGLDVATFLPAMHAAVAALTAEMDGPVHARTHRRGGTAQLAAILADLRRAFAGGLDPVVRVLAYTQPMFAGVYRTARVLADAPVRRKKRRAADTGTPGKDG